MFVEYHGNVYEYNDNELSIEDVWFAIKNNLDMKDPLIQLWRTKRIYNCTFNKIIMEKLEELDKNVFEKLISVKELT